MASLFRKLKILPTTTQSTSATKNVQAQSHGSKDIYSLIQPPSNKQVTRGCLVEVAAKAYSAKESEKKESYLLLRNTIREKLLPYLYESGAGKRIPIGTLIERRNRERKAKAQKLVQDKQRIFHKKNVEEEKFVYISDQTRLCCWDIDKRGSLGETALHICFLCNTRIHDMLAKEIISIFPNLLHDIYLSEEFYGELVLHMSIANENQEMVRFILNHSLDADPVFLGIESKFKINNKFVNINLEQRCFGSFFCPKDVKSHMRDCTDSEEVIIQYDTNYKGLIYWGEYPLCFAACANQVQAFKELLKCGVSVDLRDTNGNNILHMMVIHNNREMFDLAYQSDSDKGKDMLNQTNNQGLTPLALSATLAKKEMLDYIMELNREISWKYGDVICSHYPLDNIDTINPKDGSINSKSALHIILSNETKEHLSMLDGLLYQLLHEKWKSYAKLSFYMQAIVFFLYLCLFIPAVYLQQPVVNATAFNVTAGECTLNVPGSNQVTRTVFEALTLVGSVLYLLYFTFHIYQGGIHTFVWSIRNAPMKASFISCCFLVLAVVPSRYACSVVAENVFITLAIITCVPYSLFFCRGFKLVGPFVITIYNMIVGDLLRFFIIYIIFLLGFSQGMFIVFRGTSHYLFSSPINSIMGMFIITLGEFSDIYQDFDTARHPNAAKFLFVVYLLLVLVLLLNMLIAMMGNTFNKIAETRWEWQRQWAKIVLVMEQTVSPMNRIKKQRRYSTLAGEDASRVFVVRSVTSK